MEREFISYEQALALKELGFDELYCFGYYDREQGNKLVPALPLTNINTLNGDFEAPLKQQVFRWFREKYGWYLDLGHSERVDFYYAILKNSEPIEWRNDYSTYEKAESACIDKLIQIAKESKS